MHNSARMNVLLPTTFLQRRIILVFICSLASTRDKTEHPWGLSSHGEFLCIRRSNFSILQYMCHSPTREYCVTVSA